MAGDDDETPRPLKILLTPEEREERVRAANVALAEHAELVRLRVEVVELRAERDDWRGQVKRLEAANQTLRTAAKKGSR